MTRLICGLLVWCFSSHLQAEPTPELLQSLNPKVVRVHVALSNGDYGLGSGVVVEQNQVVTNCHVVANASSVTIISGGAAYGVKQIKPDWQHDVCIMVTEDLNIAPVSIGATRQLKYEQPVFTIGYPSFLPMPVSTYGAVKGLFALDDGMIVRASSTFRLGASGGGLFDELGQLVGIITLKSPGHQAYYYYMPVEWIQALMKQPGEAVNSKSALPFWAKAPSEWPYFMKVVQPYLTEDWANLLAIAKDWTAQEPNNNEAWFYLAMAEYATHDLIMAEQHLHRVIATNESHSDAFYYLSLIAESSGQHERALANVALLSKLDINAANQLRRELHIDGKAPE